MPDEVGDKPALPPVPSVWRFGWMLFMQPMTLDRMFVTWGWSTNISLLELWRRFRAGDPRANRVAAHWATWMLNIMPCLLIGTLVVVNALLQRNWRSGTQLAAVALAKGIGAGILVGLTQGTIPGGIVGISLGLVNGIGTIFASYAAPPGAAYGTVAGISGAVALGCLEGASQGIVAGAEVDILVKDRKSRLIANIVAFTLIISWQLVEGREYKYGIVIPHTCATILEHFPDGCSTA